MTAVFSCAGNEFTAKGKTVLIPGWKEIDQRFRATLKADTEEEVLNALPELAEGQNFSVTTDILEHFTSPPKAYTEDTLLSAMERAGAEDMPEEAERKGLGTPATRAAILEKLVQMGFVQRKGKQLVKDRFGIYAMIDKNENRDKGICKPRASVRKQLSETKQAASPKKAAARSKKHEMEV